MKTKKYALKVRKKGDYSRRIQETNFTYLPTASPENTFGVKKIH